MSQDSRQLTEEEALVLARSALLACGASEQAAESMAGAIVASERDGIASHGFAYLPIYCEHLRCGKIKGEAVPSLQQLSPSAFMVDADKGFAHPAIETGFAAAVPAAREQGVAALGLRNSYNCGVLGHHVEKAAASGLLAIGFTNAPASIAPAGGRRAVVGTNPFAVGVPDGKGSVAMVIDQSSSVVAKSEIVQHARRDEAIPEGWAYGPEGEATTDPEVALKGTMAPSGGYKGVGIALTVELLAAAVTGATLGIHASSFGGNDGGPPATGQFFILINPDPFSNGAFAQRCQDLMEAMTSQESVRLPGARRRQTRQQTDGIAVGAPLYEKIRAYL